MQFEQEQAWRRLADSVSDTVEYHTYYCTASEYERESFRIWVQQLMWTGVVLVEFVKTSGETRVMECTLSDLYGAQHPDRSETIIAEHTQPAPERKKNIDVCAVWDVKQSAWRSFRWDRLKRIDFKIGG